MSGLEVNKILAAIIMAVLIVFLISNIGDYLVNPNKDSNTKTAYNVESTESTATEENKDTSEIEIESILTLLASASLEKGEKTYKKCGSCHSYTKDGKNKVGPNLWNIVNRSKANVDGFAYSSALAEFGGVWGYEELSKFLYKPKDYIKGTKMNFAGLKKAEDRANLILFMREQSDNPVPLP